MPARTTNRMKVALRVGCVAPRMHGRFGRQIWFAGIYRAFP
eukprot:COSAG04_NODE_32291_length_252_cov_0.581699_1_plen_40_part_10